VISWFHDLFVFKCNFVRCTAAIATSITFPLIRAKVLMMQADKKSKKGDKKGKKGGGGEVGLYRLNAVDPSRLKAPGFNP
jgi:hypothetical protein